MGATLIQYLYSGDTEAIQVNLSHELIYFRDLAELEELLFLAGYGDAEIDDILVETAKAREGGVGDDLHEFFYMKRQPLPGVIYHAPPYAGFASAPPSVPWKLLALVVLGALAAWWGAVR